MLCTEPSTVGIVIATKGTSVYKVELREQRKRQKKDTSKKSENDKFAEKVGSATPQAQIATQSILKLDSKEKFARECCQANVCEPEQLG